jgi:hypothetical protein
MAGILVQDIERQMYLGKLELSDRQRIMMEQQISSSFDPRIWGRQRAPWESMSAIPVMVPDKPSTDMLRSMHIPEESGTGRQALAVEVEDLLGYTPLRRDAGAPSKLQRLLVALEIMAFDPATVKAYKEKMQAHFQALIDKEEKRIVNSNNWISLTTSVRWSMVKLVHPESGPGVCAA